jgi:hypothetical protein
MLSTVIIKKTYALICLSVTRGAIQKLNFIKVKAILYRLKTGCQWRQIPLKQFFRTKYSWNSVYSHYRKWFKEIAIFKTGVTLSFPK